jgi:pimeloyl-ACP methyl ester carboxylesterase
VSDEDAATFARLRPHDAVIEVEGASHAVQSSHPLELAEIIRQRM